MSFGLGEMVVPPSGPAPRLRLGPIAGWYANKIGRDEEDHDLGYRLQREGQDTMMMPDSTKYPSEGIELAVRRAKIPGQVWLMRLSAAAFVAGRPDTVTYPPSTRERATDGWLELRLK